MPPANRLYYGDNLEVLRTFVGELEPPKLPQWLYYGDNLEVLRKHIGDKCVDLIYLDPFFGRNRYTFPARRRV